MELFFVGLHKTEHESNWFILSQYPQLEVFIELFQYFHRTEYLSELLNDKQTVLHYVDPLQEMSHAHFSIVSALGFSD